MGAMREIVVVVQPGVDQVQGRPLEMAIVELAERQHGVVTLHQLRLAGLGAAAVAKRAQAGRLHRVYRGVYAVGRPGLTQNGHRMAAVLALGPGAVLSHRSAAGLWGLRPDSRPRVEVAVPRQGVRSRPGIELHRSATLTRADTTTRRNIPVTTVARTIVDLGNVSSRREVELAVEQAEILRIFDRRAVEEVLERVGPTRGSAAVSSVLRTLAHTSTLTESTLEEAFLQIVRDAGIADPETNARMTLPDGTPIRVDFLWRNERLAVEADGYAYHRTRQARERDTRRDQLLRLAGYEPLRFTDSQIELEPHWVRETLAALVASRADGDRSGRAGPQAA